MAAINTKRLLPLAGNVLRLVNMLSFPYVINSQSLAFWMQQEHTGTTLLRQIPSQ